MPRGYEPFYMMMRSRKGSLKATGRKERVHVTCVTVSALRQFFVPRIKDLRRESRGRDSPYALRWGPTRLRVLFPFPNG